MISPHADRLGELRYEDFLRFVLPAQPEHSWLREVASARCSQPVTKASTTCPCHDGADSGKFAPDVAFWLCQLFESEIDLCRRLKFHRKSLRELMVHKEAVLRFLDSEQGVCAGMGGLLSPAAVRAVLVDRLHALTRPQCAALLRRINPSDTCLAAFENLAKYLSPPPPPLETLLPATSGLGQASRCQSSERLGPGRYTTAAARQAHAGSPWDRASSPLRTTAPAPPRLREPLGPQQARAPHGPRRSPSPARDGWTSRQRPDSWIDGAASPVRSPQASCYSPSQPWGPNSHRRSSSSAAAPAALEEPVAASAWASGSFSKDKPEPRTPERRSFGCIDSTRLTAGPDLPSSPSRDWASNSFFSNAARPLAEPCADSWLGRSNSPQRRSNSMPPGRRPAPWQARTPQALNSSWAAGEESTDQAWWRRSTEVEPVVGPATEAEEPSSQTLRAMARQAEFDAQLEDAKALLPRGCALEAMFSMLDRGHKGYLSDMDLWQFDQDFGGPTSFASFCSLVSEVRLVRQAKQPWQPPSSDQGADAALPGRLSLRDLGLVIYPSGSQEYDALRAADSDDEAKSILYLLRNSDPCPGCGLRAQRNADAAGCPSVTCPACGTAFRCFSVVRDGVPLSAPQAEPVPAAARHQLHRLLSSAARLADALETDRRRLAQRLTSFGCSLGGVFSAIAGGRSVLGAADLRRALLRCGLQLPEHELGLLWRRYSPPGATAVEPWDFARQLQPRGAAAASAAAGLATLM